MKAERIPVHFYRYLYNEVGRDWLWVERSVLDDERLAALLHRDGLEITVLYGNGAPAGFFELDYSAERSADLAYFGLLPEWTGRRVGPWLLATVLSQAFSRGVETVTVNTCTLDHPGALKLYQRLGFSPVRRETRNLTVPAGFPMPRHIAARIPPPAGTIAPA
jgi:GNAT superfamily N-acetyltransferase